jgi:hypothetical protein
VACLSEYDLLFGGTLPTIRVPEGQYVQSAQIANTTYAYLAMANGDDGNTPPFVTGPFSAGDFLKVIVKGYDQQHAAIGSVAYYLADFRPADQRPDNGLKDNYILSDWTDLGTLQPLDNAGQPTGLGALAGARTLEFLIDTSDRDHATGFANTPLYFALDNITVAPLPEPSTIVLIASGAIAMCFWRRRRTSKR